MWRLKYYYLNFLQSLSLCYLKISLLINLNKWHIFFWRFYSILILALMILACMTIAYRILFHCIQYVGFHGWKICWNYYPCYLLNIENEKIVLCGRNKTVLFISRFQMKIQIFYWKIKIIVKIKTKQYWLF